MRGMRNVLRFIPSAIVLLSVFSLGGCGLFSSYPEEIRRARNAFASGDYAKAVSEMQERRLPANDALLKDLELGEMHRAAGQLEESNKVLLNAAERVREQSERALINVRDVAAFAGTLLVNDKARPYEAPLYERVLLHTRLCANFLLMGNLDAARVEVRQAYAEQKAAKEEFEKEISKTREAAAKRQLNSGKLEEQLTRAYADQDELLREAGNLYQNLYNYFLSSLVYEINGEYSDAYIDARTIHAQLPGFTPVRDLLPRYALKMGLRGDYEKWKELFGESSAREAAGEQGEIVLLHECGLAPVKEEIRLTVPIPVGKHWNFVTIALPKHRKSRNPVSGSRLVVDGRPLEPTEKLMDVEAAAVRELRDRMIGIALRQLIRNAGRVVLSEQVRNGGGDLPFFATILAGILMEQADLRSWTTLPKSLQASRTPLSEGKHEVRIELLDNGIVRGSVDVGSVEVRRGRLTIVGLRSTGVHGTANVANY